MSLGRPRQLLILTLEEKQKLELIARRPKTSQSQALRARIVLACAENNTHQEIACVLRTTPATVGKWRNRFVKNRLQALGDAPRSGPPRSVSDGEIEKIITRTLNANPRTPPIGAHARWPRNRG